MSWSLPGIVVLTGFKKMPADVHIAFRVPDMEEAHKLHEEMGCIVRENPAMGLYFITDPDGQWIEILPEIQD